MIDVLILTLEDNANTAWRYSKCLRMLGLNVMGFKGAIHPFYYPEQLPVHPSLAEWRVKWNGPKRALFMEVIDPEIKMLMKEARVIHYFHTYGFYYADMNFYNKKIVCNHGGRIYRLYHDIWNKTVDPFIDANIIQTPDLLNFGATNEHYMMNPVQTNYLKPFYRDTSDDLRIAHFPSMAKKKGTTGIVDTIEKVRSKFPNRLQYYGTTGVAAGSDENPPQYNIWYHNIDRMKVADIYIDQISPTVTYGGLRENKTVPFGEFANAALEAASLGKIVIANSIGVNHYAEKYGELPMVQIANNMEELEEILNWLLSEKPSKIHELQVKTREWVVRNHSMKAHAKRLWNEVYKHLM